MMVTGERGKVWGDVVKVPGWIADIDVHRGCCARISSAGTMVCSSLNTVSKRLLCDPRESLNG